MLRIYRFALVSNLNLEKTSVNSNKKEELKSNWRVVYSSNSNTWNLMNKDILVRVYRNEFQAHKELVQILMSYH